MTVVAFLLGGVSFVSAPDEPVAVVVQQLVFALVTMGVGLLLVLRRPRHKIGFVMLAIGLSFSMMGTGQALTSVSFRVGDMSRAVIWSQFEGIGWVFFILTLFNLLPLWFPTGRTANAFGQWVLRIALAVAMVGVLGTIFAERTCVSWPAGGVGDDCLELAASSWGFLEHWVGEVAGQAVLLFTGLISLLTLGHRFVRAAGAERQQLKWFAFGFALFVGALGASLVLGTNMDLVIWTAIGVVPASIALAVLRYRLYEIDKIISRTVSYALVVGLLGLGVAGVAAVAGSRFETPWLVAGSTLAVAALFNPLRRRIQDWVDRRFNRSRYDAQLVMDEFAGSLRDEVDADQVTEGWLNVVESTMQPVSAGIWVRDQR